MSKREVKDWQAFLHLSLFCGLAVAQPLFDLVGANPEFLSAHRLDGWMVVVWALIPSLLLPTACFFVCKLTAVASTRLGSLTLAAIVGMLSGVAVLPLWARLAGLDGWIAIGCSLVLGVALAVLYRSLALFRLYLTCFSPAALVFLLHFLFLSDANQLLQRGAAGRSGDPVNVGSKAPVILLVFDEFPVLSILDSGANIDSGRYPNISELTRDGVWYRNHTTNSDSTLVSIPNILSGNLPLGRNRGLPSYQNFPKNLFTLVADTHKVKAVEHGTSLCPEAVCGARPVDFRLAMEDTLVVLGHVVAPPTVRQALPAIDNDWIGFARSSRSAGPPGQDIRDFWRTLGWGTRVAEFQQFLESLEAREHSLYYFHSMFPHGAWLHLPDGRLLTVDPGGHILGMRPADPTLPYKHMWYDSKPATTVSRQRHLLQVGYADRMVGMLVDRLKELAIYDRSLIVLTSDHGVSFEPGSSRRNISGHNLVDIAGVPLVIKYPGNQPAGVSVRNSQAMDLLPTVLDVLDASGWKEFDGQSLLDPERDEGREKIIFSHAGRVDRISPENYQVELKRRAEELAGEFGEHDFLSLYKAGDRFGIVGQPVSLFPMREGNVPRVQLDHLAMLENMDRAVGVTQLVVRGTFAGDVLGNPASEVAVSVNGVIRAVNGIISVPGFENGFEVVLPESAFGPGPNRVEAWFVQQSRSGVALIRAPGHDVGGYELVPEEDGRWRILVNGKRIPLERGEVVGWCKVQKAQSEHAYDLGGWAADLVAREPASAILVFVNGKLYAELAPNRESRRTAEEFNMPGILKCGFRLVIPVPGTVAAATVEVRVFALSPRNMAAELNYPADMADWPFKPNPRPGEPAIQSDQ